ncbi:MAG: serine hydrolase domain-containing protein [Gemmatimonadota bacterium]
MTTTLVLLLLSLGASAFAQTPKEVANSRIASIIEGVIDAQGLVGTQAAVWHDGEIVFEGAWGFADIAQNVPVTRETRFLIASITKTMTGLTVLRLAEQGDIDLDEPIQTYVSEFPEQDGPPITPRMLLTHRSGIRGYNQGETTGATYFDTHYDSALSALDKFKDDPLAATPGSTELYSSYGYALLAAAVENVTGQKYAENLRSSLFEPAGMSETEAPDWRYPVDGLAPSYSFYLSHLGVAPGVEPFQARRLDFSYNPGGGNLVSNSNDLIAYGYQYLNRGSGLVSEWILDTMRTPPEGSQQGYGWWIAADDSGRPVMHATGASEAYQGSITIWPEHDLIVVALSNTWGRNSRQGGFTLTMHNAIAEAVLSD